MKKTEKETQILTRIEKSRNFYENAYLSSKEVSQNILNSTYFASSIKKLMRSDNNEIMLIIDDNEKKNGNTDIFSLEKN